MLAAPGPRDGSGTHRVWQHCLADLRAELRGTGTDMTCMSLTNSEATSTLL